MFRSTLTSTGDLPDFNVWLAFLRESHPHHARAVAYFAEESLASSPCLGLSGC